MPKYAENTTVSSDRSRAEIEKTLTKYGATQFFYGWQENSAVLGFTMHDRQVKFVLQLPDKGGDEFKLTPSGRRTRDKDAQMKAYEQSVKQRWRALNLVVKAKLEAVESGITAFEEEFLAHIMLPNGFTAGQHLIPQIEVAYEEGTMPKALPQLTTGEGNG